MIKALTSMFFLDMFLSVYLKYDTFIFAINGFFPLCEILGVVFWGVCLFVLLLLLLQLLVLLFSTAVVKAANISP